MLNFASLVTCVHNWPNGFFSRFFSGSGSEGPYSPGSTVVGEDILQQIVRNNGSEVITVADPLRAKPMFLIGLPCLEGETFSCGWSCDSFDIDIVCSTERKWASAVVMLPCAKGRGNPPVTNFVPCVITVRESNSGSAMLSIFNPNGYWGVVACLLDDDCELPMFIGVDPVDGDGPNCGTNTGIAKKDTVHRTSLGGVMFAKSYVYKQPSLFVRLPKQR